MRRDLIRLKQIWNVTIAENIPKPEKDIKKHHKSQKVLKKKKIYHTKALNDKTAKTQKWKKKNLSQS